MLGAYSLEKIFSFRDKKTIIYETLWIAGLLLISCIQQNTYHDFLFPFTIFSDYAIDIIENKSLLHFFIKKT